MFPAPNRWSADIEFRGRIAVCGAESGIPTSAARSQSEKPLRPPGVLCPGIVALCLFLGACVSAPRGPAATLANAGIASTNAFARDYRTTATRLRDVDVSDAFANTLAYCSNPNIPCEPQLKPGTNLQAREDLATAVELRGRAVDALSAAYAALKTEAEYDARADLVTATNGAIDSVNAFSASILAVSGSAAAPGASLISEPLKQIVGFGAGLFADRSQSKRLKAGSRAIGEATRRLRDSLAVEAFIFDSLAAYIEESRLSAKLSLLEAGLASHQSVVLPMIEDMQLKPADGLEATIRKSPPTQAAIRAILIAESRSEVAQTRARYAASLKALDELVRAHAEFEQDRPLTLADLDRFLSELNQATTSKD